MSARDSAARGKSGVPFPNERLVREIAEKFRCAQDDPIGVHRAVDAADVVGIVDPFAFAPFGEGPSAYRS